MREIAIIGAGGLGREVACLIQHINEQHGKTWELIGYFDDGIPKGEQNVIGDTDDLNNWKRPLDVVISIGNSHVLKKMATKITNPLIQFPNIIHPNTQFYNRASVVLGKGNIIGCNSIISCNIEIGDFNLFNTMINIGHDATIGNYNVIMPNVNISGGVAVGDENLLGVKCTVLQYCKIGNRVRVGANSVIIRNTKDDALYLGIPATKVKL